MKNIILILSLFLLYNCSGKQDNKQENYDNILGKWEFVSSVPNTIETSSVTKTSRIKKSLKEKADPDSKFFMELKEGGKGVNFISNNEGKYQKFDFTYDIKKGNLFIKDENDRITQFKIDSVNNEKLELTMDLTNYFKKEFPEVKVMEVTSNVIYKKVDSLNIKIAEQ